MEDNFFFNFEILMFVIEVLNGVDLIYLYSMYVYFL